MSSETMTLSAASVAADYRRTLLRRLLLVAVLLSLLAVSLTLDVTTGASGMPLAEFWQTLWHPATADPATEVIVWQIRLPYALIAIAAGLALGLAGAEMQTVLHNPLADPFTLGLQPAAAFGAALAILLDVSIPGVPGPWMLPVNAFVFALGSALLLDVVARWSNMPTSGVVLFGIALFFSFNALVSLLQFVSTADSLQDLVFWLMGSLSRADWPKIALLFGAFALILPWSLSQSWRLTALRLGEDRAASFGINVRRLRLSSLLRASLLTALAVAFVGTIGFIGLIAPHIARRLVGEDHRFYLPVSALTGAAILSMASVVTKNLVPGVIVPVGIVTSLVGIPFFIAIVLRNGGRQ
ncbi:MULTISPECIES: FecCD family ABC transporter permease [Chromobacterium]|uniref:Iron ABC transporter permease n=2 Tax=Chromobacterium TaxID=535 RepID=A0ABS3GMN0_9NEIS|nr:MULTISPECIES: iron ABC transporter permease [Chromobacterium]AXT48014.1 iron ABC transporter permease [Chromobacterium rhizoryzae]MBK0415019.1 iron ABC transporter permease [Chromobacterium haemolyticum]MBO0416311.1 iron ABC transporter permease [Chromobacterium haemolyticum]MBO0499657.1 iron ABC transporter permease [Chromobacterium haemolyticum]